MSSFKLEDGRWCCQYRIPDRKNPVREYFGRGLEGKKAAHTRDLEVKLAKARGDKLTRSSSMKFDDLADLYIRFRRAEGRTLNWAKDLHSLLHNHFIRLIPNIPVDQLGYGDILVIAEHYSDKAPATKNRYMDYMHAIFRFGLDHELIQKDPMRKWRKVKEKRREMKLTVEDLKRIWANAEPHLQWIIEVEWELGTRPGISELFSLKWEDVDFQSRVINVRGTKTIRSDRVIPISVEFCSRLIEKKNTARTNYLIEYKGKPLTNCRKSFHSACQRAGIAYDVRMYDIRHLFATVMLSEGGDLQAVSRILGHSSTRMTADVYYHELKGEKERALAKRPSIHEERESKVVRIG